MSVPAQVQTLLAQGRLQQAEQLLELLLQATPDDADLWRARGHVALNQGKLELALSASRRATELNALSGPAWTQLGSLEQAVGRLDLAERALQRACRIDHGPANLTRLAGVLRQIGRTEEAVDLLRQARAAKPPHPPAWILAGDIALEREDWQTAEALLSEALEQDGRRAPTHLKLGRALREQGKLEAAREEFDRAWALDRHLYMAMAEGLHVRRRLNLWEDLDGRAAELASSAQLCIPGISPMDFLSESDDPQSQLQCARTEAEGVLRRLRKEFPDGLAPTPRGYPERPRVAFVSNGYGNERTGQPCVGLFENLPAQRPVILLYATGGDNNSPLRERLRKVTDGLHDVSGWRPERIARHMIEQQVDILVDLRGWARGGSPQVMALRPAPLQLSWLGYPGSSGAPWIDYLIADRQTIPDAERAGYSEHIVRLPHCFQPTDIEAQPGPDTRRRDYGLPGSGVIYACFNARHKINPAVWAQWMEILRLVPDSLLWLLTHDGLEQADQRLRDSAQAADIDPERLHFLPRQPHPEYLSALRLADLYLDTWPYGAQATASDALLVGTPVLTKPGRSYASRSAASQLHTLGLDELVADSVERYTDLAILIGGSADLLADLQGKLAARRATSRLFDMRSYAADFCNALQQLWQRFRSDQPPADLDL